MCIKADFKDVHTATEDITAYKVVTKERTSYFGVQRRWGQIKTLVQYFEAIEIFSNLGKEFSYGDGDTVSSMFPDTPGIYCFSNRDEAEHFLFLEGDGIVIKVLIPKDTKFVKGIFQSREYECVNAETITVLHEVKPEYTVKLKI